MPVHQDKLRKDAEKKREIEGVNSNTKFKHKLIYTRQERIGNFILFYDKQRHIMTIDVFKGLIQF